MTIVLGPDVTAADVDDGLVLLDERSGRYWQLNRAGAATLRLLLDGSSPDEAARTLTRDTPGAAGRARTDVQKLVASLVEARLVVAP